MPRKNRRGPQLPTRQERPSAPVSNLGHQRTRGPRREREHGSLGATTSLAASKAETGVFASPEDNPHKATQLSSESAILPFNMLPWTPEDLNAVPQSRPSFLERWVASVECYAFQLGQSQMGRDWGREPCLRALHLPRLKRGSECPLLPEEVSSCHPPGSGLLRSPKTRWREESPWAEPALTKSKQGQRSVYSRLPLPACLLPARRDAQVVPALPHDV